MTPLDLRLADLPSTLSAATGLSLTGQNPHVQLPRGV